MKKVLIVAFVLALMGGAVSCKKEEVKPIEGPATDTVKPYEDPIYVEGVFNPGRHLATVVAGGHNEQWNWSATTPKQLTSITDPTMGATTSLTYKGSGLLASATQTSNGSTTKINFDYEAGGTLNSYTILLGGKSVATCNAGYSGGHISELNYRDVDVAYLAQIGGIDLGSDFQVNSLTMDDNFNWTGNNPVKETLAINLDGRISLRALDELAHDEIVNLFGSTLASVAEAFINLMVLNMGDSTYATTVSGSIASDYTFDDKYNPYRGLWYHGLTMQPASLSANNLLSTTTNGNLHVSIVFTMPAQCPSFLSDYSMYWSVIRMLIDGRELSRDIPYSSTETLTYTYDAIGFPTTCTDQDGLTTTYTYIEK